jgi:alpha-aminoadipate/glutamate carrier protein LysW
MSIDRKGTVMTIAPCPQCDAEVRIEDDARQHEIVECADCRSELELISAEPPTLALAPEIEEDWGE